MPPAAAYPLPDPLPETGSPGAPTAFTPRAIGFWLYGFSVVVAAARVVPSYVLAHADFRTFYCAARLLAADRTHLYDLAAQTRIQNTFVSNESIALAFLHPAYEALLFRPFAALSYRPAYFAWLICNFLIFAAAFIASPPPVSPALKRWSPSFLFLLFVPTFMCMLSGQDSFIFLLLMAFVWRSLQRSQDRTAGILLALGLFKLQLVLVIVALVSIRRGPRLLTGFLPAAAAIAALCLCITGLNGFRDYLHLLANASLATRAAQNTADTVSVWPMAMPNLFGLLYTCGARLLTPPIAFALNAVLSAVLFLFCAWQARTARSLAVVFTIAICCALLLSHHLFAYDYTLLLLPIFLLDSRRHALVTAVAYGLPVALSVLHGVDWFAGLAVVPFLFLWECCSLPAPHPVPSPATAT